MTQQLISAYLDQSELYYSGSIDAMIPIAKMEPRHAANAAEKMLRDAARWATDSGHPLDKRPFSWVTSLPLYQALAVRGQQSSGVAQSVRMVAALRQR